MFIFNNLYPRRIYSIHHHIRRRPHSRRRCHRNYRCHRFKRLHLNTRIHRPCISLTNNIRCDRRHRLQRSRRANRCHRRLRIRRQRRDGSPRRRRLTLMLRQQVQIRHPIPPSLSQPNRLSRTMLSMLRIHPPLQRSLLRPSLLSPPPLSLRHRTSILLISTRHLPTYHPLLRHLHIVKLMLPSLAMTLRHR